MGTQLLRQALTVVVLLFASCHNLIAQQIKLTNNEKVEGELSKQGEVDTYIFTTQKTDSITIEVFSDEVRVKVGLKKLGERNYLKLSAVQGHRIAYGLVDGFKVVARPDSSEIPALGEGQYIITVGPSNVYRGTGKYSIMVSGLRDKNGGQGSSLPESDAGRLRRLKSELDEVRSREKLLELEIKSLELKLTGPNKSS